MDNDYSKVGDITIDDQVIAEYVSEEVLKHKNVSRFSTSLAEGITKNILGRDSVTSGVKIQNDEGNISISLHIIVYFGINIPQLSYELQMNIKQSVEAFTGLNVKEVNISVEGIDRVADKR